MMLDLGAAHARPRARRSGIAAAGVAGRRRPHAGHPLAAGPLRPGAADRRAGCSTRARRARGRRCPPRDELAVPSRDRAPAAVLGRPRDPAGHRAVHGERPRRRAVVPVEHRVHPAHQRARRRRRRPPHRVRRQYLVLGLGDVYLGAPVATPLDPRHRLVTTKYNPARTWTPENAVGIGGAYLCIYGMEGPGGYQFVGRTVQVWNRYRTRPVRVRGPVAAALLRPDPLVPGRGRRAARPARRPRGRAARSRHRPTATFRLADHHRVLPSARPTSIAAFRAAPDAAFAAERAAWEAAGEFDAGPAAPPVAAAAAEVRVPAGGVLVEAPLSASVWRVDVRPARGRARATVSGARGDEDRDRDRLAGRRQRARGRRRRG